MTVGCCDMTWGLLLILLFVYKLYGNVWRNCLFVNKLFLRNYLYAMQIYHL